MFAALHAYAERHGHLALTAPFDVLFSDGDVVEPDVVVVLGKHLSRLHERFLRGAPDLVVEVSSAPTRRRDLGRKRHLYERMRVAEYWFVDVEAANVVVHKLHDAGYAPPTIVDVGDDLTCAQLPELRIAVAALFRPLP